MRSVLAPAARAALPVAVSAVLLVLSPAARAQGRQPLNAQEQGRVNQAIDRGVQSLLATQGPLGTWAKPDARTYQVGYAVLPGLTLLECGVPPKDPSVQRVAALVRRTGPGLDHTYEVSLAILFLDRLGDPQDEVLIQVLALRLVAGQAPSGGWGYKVPILLGPDNTALLTALRQSEPRTAVGLL